MNSCEAKKVAFFIMGSKGHYVLKEFINSFGGSAVVYIVSEQNKAVKYDAYNDIKSLASIHNIRFFDRKNFDSSVEVDADAMKFAIGWRWLIENETNLLVLHDSLLPKYRGFAPLVNSLINEEAEIGVTCLVASEEYDCGDIVCQKSVDVNYPIKISEAIEKIEPLYFELVASVFKSTLNGNLLPRLVQNNADATYSLWLDSKDYFIDWSWSARKIKRFIDAVGFPYDGAKAILNNDTLIFIEAEEVADVFIEHRERHIGKVIFYRDKFPIIVCVQGLLMLKKMTDVNGNTVKMNFRSRFE
jgi:methionyl-tRNA formyltransferase